MDLKESQILGHGVTSHWYYRSKGSALLDLLKEVGRDTVIDVGAGSAYFARRLVANGKTASVECVDPRYAEEHREHIGDACLHHRRQPSGNPATLVMMMDVIEHVDDDVELLQRYADLLEPGGHILVSVPAYQWLWSGHDEFLEHRRRYNKRGLHEALRRAGLEPTQTRFFLSLLFPVVALLRLLQRRDTSPRSSLRSHSRVTNHLLTGLHTLERKTLFRLNQWFGLTIFCLARKAD